MFRNGCNQAIRLPRGMEVDADQVLIERQGDVLTIRPRPRDWDWDHYFATCPSFDPNFPSDIDDLPAEEKAQVW